jgi:hypothetical protein
MSIHDALAAGHVYLERTGSGIQWSPTVAKLYRDGQVVAEASHQTASPWEFWSTLAFKDAFPQITHWWFHSGWTGQVKISRPFATQGEAVVTGYMQLLGPEVPASLYTIQDEGDRVMIDVPYPPNDFRPVNVPLRLALARMVWGVINDDIDADTWYDATSLVGRDELEAAFPVDEGALQVDVPSRLTAMVEAGADADALLPKTVVWRLDSFEGMGVREGWCRMMGLQPVEVAQLA